MSLTRGALLSLACLAVSCIELPAESDGGSPGGYIDEGFAGSGGTGGAPGSCADLDPEACRSSAECSFQELDLKFIPDEYQETEGQPQFKGHCIEAEGQPCHLLDEAACAPQEACVIRHYDDGSFGDCRSAAEAACGRLDEGQCATRLDCGWGDGGCEEIGLPCGAQPSPEACVASGCFWWNEDCHEAQAPARCDQPDPARCEAANCEWGPEGCHPPTVGCEGLDPGTCAARPDCVGSRQRDESFICVSHEGCISLSFSDCEQNPSCYSHVSEGCEGCVCDPGDPDCAHDCACETWGECLPYEPQSCEDLGPDACVVDPHCQLHEVEVCADSAREAEEPPEGVPMPEPCWVEEICLPAPPSSCAEYAEPERCDQDPACGWRWDGEGCDCDDADDTDVDCFCERWGECLPQEPEACGAIFEPEACMENPACEWLQDRDGLCDCPEGVECRCLDGGSCVERQTEGCESLSPERCEQAPGCHIEPLSDADICLDCVCDPDDADCECGCLVEL